MPSQTPPASEAQDRTGAARLTRRGRTRRPPGRGQRGYIHLSSDIPPVDPQARLPIIRPSNSGSAQTFSTLTRHRLSRTRDHDPLGMTVQEAVDQLGEHNDTLSSALREPLPNVAAESEDVENGIYFVDSQGDTIRRPKRRKLDNDPIGHKEAPPKYGYRGRVVPGGLKMQVESCDGGTTTMPLGLPGDYRVENVLRNNNNAYCTDQSKCNLILKHRGGMPFTLTNLVIRSPNTGYTARLQEGLIFVAMDKDDLLYRTERWDLRGRHESPSDSSGPRSMERIDPQRYLPPLSMQEMELPQQHSGGVSRNDGPEWSNRYAVVQEQLPSPYPAARAVRRTGGDLPALSRMNTEEDLAEQSYYRHNSWQRIEPGGRPVRVSTVTQTTSPPLEPVLAEAPYSPTYQGFKITASDDILSLHLTDSDFECDSPVSPRAPATSSDIDQNRERERYLDDMWARLSTISRRFDDQRATAPTPPHAIIPNGRRFPIPPPPPPQPPGPNGGGSGGDEDEEEDDHEYLGEQDNLMIAVDSSSASTTDADNDTHPTRLPPIRTHPDAHAPIIIDPSSADLARLGRARRNQRSEQLALLQHRGLMNPNYRPSWREYEVLQQSRPRRFEWVPNHVHRSGLKRGPSEKSEVLQPHARFFIRKGREGTSVKFSPPVSGRYILVKMWAPEGEENVDVSAILAYGYGGPRSFETAKMV